MENGVSVVLEVRTLMVEMSGSTEEDCRISGAVKIGALSIISEASDESVGVFVVLKYRRGETLSGKWLGLVVLNGKGGIVIRSGAVDVSIPLVLCTSPILLVDLFVASISVVGSCVVLSIPTPCVPELPGDNADKVTPEVPLSTADVIVKDISNCVVVSVEVLENGPEGVKGRDVTK